MNLVSERTIVQALQQVPAERWCDVLSYIFTLQQTTDRDTDLAALVANTWTADALLRLPPSLQDLVLRQQATELIARTGLDPSPGHSLRWWSARELSKLPLEQRGIILEASAIFAEKEYLTNPDLLAEEVLGENDLYDDYPDSTESNATNPATR